MKEFEAKVKEMARLHPGWSDRDIAIELMRIFGKRPVYPTIRQWMREERDKPKET